MTPYSRISSWARLSSFAFLFVGISCLLNLSGLLGNKCSAANEIIGDSTASITLDTSKLTVNVVPGETGYTSKSITISTNDTESYALTITAPATLKNKTSNTTNPWSYAYGQSGELSSMTYTSFDGSTKELESGTESDGTTKTLAFSSTFAEGLATGHYEAEVTLGLTATPKTILGIWTLADNTQKNSGITTMQEMTPEICNQVSTPTAVDTPGGTKAPTMQLKDTRDDNVYSIAKFPDGRCWMQENLRIVNKTITPDDSNVSSNFTIPASNITGFSSFSDEDAYSNKAYVSDASGMTTGYYNWYTATAGSGKKGVDSGSVGSSICPKGWALPSGGDDGVYTKLYSDLKNPSNSILQSLPYNFVKSGIVTSSSEQINGSIHGYWLSRTVKDSANVYSFNVYSTGVNPSVGVGRQLGIAVRCVAAEPEPKTFTLTYKGNGGEGYLNANTVPASQTCTTTSNSCTITITTDQPTAWCSTYFRRWDKNPNANEGTTTSDSYQPGSQITLTGDTTLYAIWYRTSTMECAS